MMKKNFRVYRAEEFIAAITQHIPEKSFQIVRYYGWYSNKSRWIRNKQGTERSSDEPVAEPDIEIIDVFDYRPPHIPSKSWSQLIKKVYEVDPLLLSSLWRRDENNQFHYRSSGNTADS